MYAHIDVVFLSFFFREGATRSGLVLRGPGLETLWSLTTLTSSESYLVQKRNWNKLIDVLNYLCYLILGS
jgi:hypothetical protein